MAATKAKSSKGAKLEVGNGATPEVFTAVAEVKSISGVEVSGDSTDATHLGSEVDESIPGRVKPGEVSCEANWVDDDTTQDAILDDLQDGTPHNFRVVNADGKGYGFPGFATGFGVKMAVGEVQSLSFKVKISGKLTKVTGS